MTCPLLYVRPVPHECLAKMRDRLREVAVAPPPLMNHLRACDAETLSNLCGTNKLIDIDLATHRSVPAVYTCTHTITIRVRLYTARESRLRSRDMSAGGDDSFLEYWRYIEPTHRATCQTRGKCDTRTWV